ncbi:MAG TPA: hypothetical protein P5277_04650 [Candidatus Paceibacterota bacterium]|nr:hypothetical protein [Candidatus Paceibacterota bacterium]
MTDFKAPSAGTIKRATPSNPISNIFKSIIGLFIGILIILFLAPVVLWIAESQDSAKIFSHSKEVLSTSGVSGYIYTIDQANAETQMSCYENKVEGNCIYYSYKLEELKYTIKDHCGELKSNQKVIETKGQKCHRNSNDEEICEQCYSVNESNWQIIKSDGKFLPFKVGNFKIINPENAKIIGEEKYVKEIDETHRESMSYIKDKSRLLISGNSDGSIISNGGQKKYLLISTKDYQGTYNQLKSQDRISAWILRIITFVILLVGYLLIFGPISVMSNYVRKIPLLGKWIDNAIGSMIFFLSLLLAIVHFIILWILIIIIKNILLIALIIAIVLGAFFIYTKLRKNNN